MKLKKQLSKEAKQDLRDIRLYTKELWGSSQSVKYLGSIDSVFDILVDNPLIGIHNPEIREELFYFNHGRHVIYYMVLPKKLAIIRVLSQRIKQELELKNTHSPD